MEPSGISIGGILMNARKRIAKTKKKISEEVGLPASTIGTMERRHEPYPKTRRIMREDPQRFIDAYQLNPEEQKQFMERLGIAHSKKISATDQIAFILAEIMELSAEQRRKLIHMVQAYDHSENEAK